MKWWLRFGHTHTHTWLCISVMRRNVQDIPPLPSWIMIKSPHLLVLIYSFLPLDIKHKKQCCAKLHIKSCNYHNKIAIFNTHIIQKSHSKNPHSPASWGSPWMFWRKGTLTKSKKKYHEAHVVFPSAASKRIPGKIPIITRMKYYMFWGSGIPTKQSLVCQIASILARFG